MGVLILNEARGAMENVIEQFIDVVSDIVIITKSQKVEEPQLTAAQEHLFDLSGMIQDFFDIKSTLDKNKLAKAIENLKNLKPDMSSIGPTTSADNSSDIIDDQPMLPGTTISKQELSRLPSGEQEKVKDFTKAIGGITGEVRNAIKKFVLKAFELGGFEIQELSEDISRVQELTSNLADEKLSDNPETLDALKKVIEKMNEAYDSLEEDEKEILTKSFDNEDMYELIPMFFVQLAYMNPKTRDVALKTLAPSPTEPGETQALTDTSLDSNESGASISAPDAIKFAQQYSWINDPILNKLGSFEVMPEPENLKRIIQKIEAAPVPNEEKKETFEKIVDTKNWFESLSDSDQALYLMLDNEAFKILRKKGILQEDNFEDQMSSELNKYMSKQKNVSNKKDIVEAYIEAMKIFNDNDKAAIVSLFNKNKQEFVSNLYVMSVLPKYKITPDVLSSFIDKDAKSKFSASDIKQKAVSPSSWEFDDDFEQEPSVSKEPFLSDDELGKEPSVSKEPFLSDDELGKEPSASKEPYPKQKFQKDLRTLERTFKKAKAESGSGDKIISGFLNIYNQMFKDMKQREMDNINEALPSSKETKKQYDEPWKDKRKEKNYFI
jgi:hypothetical protein